MHFVKEENVSMAIFDALDVQISLEKTAKLMRSRMRSALLIDVLFRKMYLMQYKKTFLNSKTFYNIINKILYMKLSILNTFVLLIW